MKKKKKKKERKVLIAPKIIIIIIIVITIINDGHRATVRPPRGIGGDLLRETRHRRRSEAGTTCKSELPTSPVSLPRERDREERVSDRARNCG